MRTLLTNIRKILFAAIGIPLFIIGVILIPLPGPGLLLCFISLFMLSKVSDKAEFYFKKTQLAVTNIYRSSQTRADKLEQRMNAWWDNRHTNKNKR